MRFQTEHVLHFGDHRLDLGREQLWRGTEPVALRPKTWQVLLFLLQRPGMLVSAEALLDAIWPRMALTPKTLTNRMVELRRALGDDPTKPRIVQTVHRRGYRLIAPVSTTASLASAEPAPGPGGPALALSSAPRLFAGRAAELAILARLRAAAGEGRRQVVLIGGESGMGKTALIDAFVASSEPATVLCGRGTCVEQCGEREVLGPVLALLADLAAGPEAALVLSLLRRCAPSWLLQLPWLLDEDEARELRRNLTGVGSGRMLREGCALFEKLSQVRLLVLVLEDLQWSDPATLDLLTFIAQVRRPARLLLLASYQPAEARRSAHPVTAIARRLVAQDQAVELMLGPLTSE